MVILTKRHIKNLEDKYYWSGCRDWSPFPRELKKLLLEEYGKEPFPYEWSDNDLHVGTRRIIESYFTNNN